MSLLFRTLRSGSSGNSQLLVSGGCALLIDLGLPTNTALKQCLAELRQRGIKLLAALVTHEHGDHFSPGPLRAMKGLELPVYAPRRAIAHAENQMKLGFWSGRPEMVAFDEGEDWERMWTVGPFEIHPIEVTHHPGGSCFAFEIRVERCGAGVGELKAVFATDLCDARALPGRLIDADLIYLESNHDPFLLQRHPNPSSRFHLRNEQAAGLLAEARRASKGPPGHVCLGHLSYQRNTPTLALDAVAAAFEEMSQELDFPVTCAPRQVAGVWVEVE